MLRDTIIASDKIRAKIVKEGHTVTLNQVMEIARLEVSTQQHLERMQETAKVNYIQYRKSTKGKKGKKSPPSGTGANSHRGHGMSSKPSGKGRKLPFLPDTCYRCGKADTKRVQDCKAVDTTCRGCGKKGHFEKVCLKGKHSTHSLGKFHRLPPALQGQGPVVNPSTLMMEDNQCTLIWSVSPM